MSIVVNKPYYFCKVRIKVKYLNCLLKSMLLICRKNRLLTASIIEARGAERFGLVAEALEPGGLKTFYQSITRSEQRHYELFLDLARIYIEPAVVATRWQELLEIEAGIVAALPHRAALH